MKDESDIEFIIGTDVVAVHPMTPYNSMACSFLAALSKALLLDSRANAYPDVMAFAFWCRAANIEKLKNEFEACNPYARKRLGLGNVFHITPSNVPVNFAYSFVFGLLSGNANVVRVPSKTYPQIDIICNAFNILLAQDRFSELRNMTAFVRYGHCDSITKMFSANCNARIIWGGDATILKIRAMPIPARGVDIAFADRYSLCVMGGNAICALDDVGLERLAERFYNDTYLMDQNACSSPHLVIWTGHDIVKAKNRFWTAVGKTVQKKYTLKQVHAVDKLTHLCKDAIEQECIDGFLKIHNYLYRLHLKELPCTVDMLTGKFGYFYEYESASFDELAMIVNAHYQTLTYWGVDKRAIIDFVVQNRLGGIDRIVPVGNALDIGVIWDGYDIIASLSRIITVT